MNSPFIGFGKLAVALLLLCLLQTPQAQKSPQIPLPFSDWVATDALGRALPLPEAVGGPRAGKYVGLFFYIWHGHHKANAIRDLTKMIQANPSKPAYGIQGEFHFWGEPEEGYFRSEDPWMIRRHLAMISAAGVDFIFFDVTNRSTYLDVVDVLCKVSMEMRALGIKTPYISFVSNSKSGVTLNELYDQVYSKNKYKELWFIWDGKPLIFGNPEDPELRNNVRNFFNLKYSWAWTAARANPDHWQWLAQYPQTYGWSGDKDKAIQVPVAKASHPVNNRGESYSNGQQPPIDQFGLTQFTGQGLHFSEQWKRAHELDPEVIMLTQWNEWLAQRQISTSTSKPGFLGKPTEVGDTYFVDVYTQEYNRDIAPMKGGHTDNHYYLMLDNIRKYKGMAPRQKALKQVAITVDGQFADWKDALPVFQDYTGDVAHRDFLRYDSQAKYTNKTGRNDIVESRVALKDNMLYFYVKTAAALTPHTGNNWMLLFINADKNKQTGWEGFDYALNLKVTSDRKASLSKWGTNSWNETAQVDYRYAGKELEIAVPLAGLGLKAAADITVDFQWADNIQKLGDITEFFLNGDVAPDRRANYRFETSIWPSTNLLTHKAVGSSEQLAIRQITWGKSGEMEIAWHRQPQSVLPINFRLVDIKGQVVGQESRLPAAMHRLTFNTIDIDGLYFLLVSQGEYQVVNKVVVHP